jgi:hypothetical protein
MSNLVAEDLDLAVAPMEGYLLVGRVIVCIDLEM